MTEIPNEYADLIQSDIDQKLEKLWQDLIDCAKIDQNVKMCRQILNQIEILKTSSVIPWKRS